MMSENEQAPENEKLNNYEFDLDIEEQRRQQAEAETDVAKVSSRACVRESLSTG